MKNRNKSDPKFQEPMFVDYLLDARLVSPGTYLVRGVGGCGVNPCPNYWIIVFGHDKDKSLVIYKKGRRG